MDRSSLVVLVVLVMHVWLGGQAQGLVCGRVVWGGERNNRLGWTTLDGVGVERETFLIFPDFFSYQHCVVSIYRKIINTFQD